jgi:hypothetical protein
LSDGKKWYRYNADDELHRDRKTQQQSRREHTTTVLVSLRALRR